MECKVLSPEPFSSSFGFHEQWKPQNDLLVMLNTSTNTSQIARQTFTHLDRLFLRNESSISTRNKFTNIFAEATSSLTSNPKRCKVKPFRLVPVQLQRQDQGPKASMQDRMSERPRIMGIQTQVVTEVRDIRPIQASNTYRNENGMWMTIDPSGHHIPMGKQTPPAEIACHLYQAPLRPKRLVFKG